MHLILFGFKGSGKTYWGKRLAREFEMPFMDTDQRISELYGKPLSCREIHQAVGEVGFRELEHQSITSLTDLAEPTVIALGGGAILVPENRYLLEKIGILIYLKASYATLKKRTLNDPLPSFLNPLAPEDSFNAYYEKRLPLYQIVSARMIDVDQKPVIKQFKELITYGK